MAGDALVAVHDLVLGTVVMMAPEDAAAAVADFPQRYSFVGANPQTMVASLATFMESPEATPLPVITGDTSTAPALGSLIVALAGLGLIVNQTTTAAPGNNGVPMISGTPQVGQPLTATQGVWTNSPTGFLYQWNSGGVAVSGATGTTYTPAPVDIGNTITVSIVAMNTAGFSNPAISQPTASVIDVFPTDVSPPVISGIAQVGNMIAGSVGGWLGSPTSFIYQWNGNGTPIAGATALAYTPVAADVGTLLTLSVTAIDTGGTNTATSAPTVAVLPAIPTNVTAPTVSGIAQVGQLLTATPGVWRNIPTSFAYQWMSGLAPATGPGAMSSAYTPVTADIGNALTVSVIATNAGGSSAASVSAPTAAIIPIAMAPVNITVPTTYGTVQVGQVLTATNGTWSNLPTTFNYQWNRGGTAIAVNGTAVTYIPVAADVGQLLTVSVTASNGTGTSSPATSLATVAVIDIIPTITTPPSIPGMPQVGSPITAAPGVWTHNPTSIAYQWQVAGVNGTGAGATTETYTPVSGDATDTLTITETATNSGGTGTPSTSAASAAVAAVTGSNSTMIITAME